MVEKLSAADAHYLDTGTELNAPPAAGADDDRDPLDAAIEDDTDDEVAPAAKVADPAPKPAKGAKDAGKAAGPAVVDPAKPVTTEKPKPPEGFVEEGAVAAERNRRKAAEKRATDVERQNAEYRARTEERLRIMQEGWTRPQPAEDPNAAPDIDVDPLGFIRHVGEQVGQLRQMTAQERQQHEQHAQVQQAWNTVEQTYRADAQNFAQENPDFGEAYNFFSQSLARELGRHPKLRGNPQALAAAMRQQELAFADAALAAGESPAEYIFGLAADRGWTKKAPDPAPDPAPKPDGQAAAAGKGGPVLGKQPTAAEQIDRLTAAKEASTSLSSAGGSAGGNKITWADIDRMTDKQFQEFIRRKNAKDPHGYDKWVDRQVARE